jgi:hypothetical protein
MDYNYLNQINSKIILRTVCFINVVQHCTVIQKNIAVPGATGRRLQTLVYLSHRYQNCPPIHLSISGKSDKVNQFNELS